MQMLPGAVADFGDWSSWAQGIVKPPQAFTGLVLGLLGTVFGMLVHQVATHCLERGGLMASLWNMYTAVMDAKLQSAGHQV